MSKLYNIGHIGKTGGKLLRSQYKLWKKEREKSKVKNQRNDYRTFLFVKYGVVPGSEED